MIFTNLRLLGWGKVCTVLALACQFTTSVTVAMAQEGVTPPQPTTEGTLLRMGFMFVMVYLIFHFMVIKPQRTKFTEQQKLLASLKRGEQVVTSGGMVAKVSAVEKEHVVLELAPTVKVKFELAHIVKRLDKAEKAEAA
jgi:preprotein translocase subunit YajC